DLAVTKAKLAGEHSGRLPREARLLVTARCSFVRGQWDDAISSYAELHHSFPDSIEYGLGWIKALNRAGRSSDALKAVQSLQAQPSMASKAARLHLAEAETAWLLSDRKRMVEAAG